MTIIDSIFQLFYEKGHGAYFGEAVTETEHALQCAYLAEQSGATPDVVTAALLHDIGHLLHGLPEDIADRGIDGRHEVQGAAWLANYFGAAVVDPVRLHVAAKRYLCCVEADYYSALSEASKRSLQLQGGLMTAEEMRDFEREPHFGTAIAVRRWDDAAKIPGLIVPGVEHYRGYLAAVLNNKENT